MLIVFDLILTSIYPTMFNLLKSLFKSNKSKETNSFINKWITENHLYEPKDLLLVNDFNLLGLVTLNNFTFDKIKLNNQWLNIVDIQYKDFINLSLLDRNTNQYLDGNISSDVQMSASMDYLMDNKDYIEFVNSRYYGVDEKEYQNIYSQMFSIFNHKVKFNGNEINKIFNYDNGYIIKQILYIYNKGVSINFRLRNSNMLLKGNLIEILDDRYLIINIKNNILPNEDNKFMNEYLSSKRFIKYPTNIFHKTQIENNNDIILLLFKEISIKSFIQIIDINQIDYINIPNLEKIKQNYNCMLAINEKLKYEKELENEGNEYRKEIKSLYS